MHVNNHDEYITTSEFSKLRKENFKARLPQASLVTKADFDAKLGSLNKKVTSKKSKHLFVENELKKLKTFDSSYFKGQNRFEEDGSQRFLVFQAVNKYFKKIPKRFFDEVIKPPNNNLVLTVKYTGKSMYIKFNGSCLKQDKLTFNHKQTVKKYTVYDLKSNLHNFCPTLQTYLICAVKLIKNADFDK